MTGGIDSILSSRVAAGRTNPQGLMNSYQQNSSLIDLLALQKLKSEKEAAARQLMLQSGSGGTPPTVREQREKELTDMTKQELAQQVGGVAQKQMSDQQSAMQRMMQGVGGLPTPGIAGMAGGGVVGYAEGGDVEDETMRMSLIRKLIERGMTPEAAAVEADRTLSRNLIPDFTTPLRAITPDFLAPAQGIMSAATYPGRAVVGAAADLLKGDGNDSRQGQYGAGISALPRPAPERNVPAHGPSALDAAYVSGIGQGTKPQEEIVGYDGAGNPITASKLAGIVAPGNDEIVGYDGAGNPITASKLQEITRLAPRRGDANRPDYAALQKFGGDVATSVAQGVKRLPQTLGKTASIVENAIRGEGAPAPMATPEVSATETQPIEQPGGIAQFVQPAATQPAARYPLPQPSINVPTAGRGAVKSPVDFLKASMPSQGRSGIAALPQASAQDAEYEALLDRRRQALARAEDPNRQLLQTLAAFGRGASRDTDLGMALGQGGEEVSKYRAQKDAEISAALEGLLKPMEAKKAEERAQQRATDMFDAEAGLSREIEGMRSQNALDVQNLRLQADAAEADARLAAAQGLAIGEAKAKATEMLDLEIAAIEKQLSDPAAGVGFFGGTGDRQKLEADLANAKAARAEIDRRIDAIYGQRGASSGYNPDDFSVTVRQ